MSNEVAKTILAQLGNNKFIAMTGAKQFTAYDNGLSFKIGRNAKSVNYVKITLNGNDLYDMTFERVTLSKKTWDVKHTVKAQYKDVYFDQLQELFTEATGMYTRLF